MVRGLIFGGLAFAAAFAAERQWRVVAKDVARYDRIRAISGDPSLLRQGFAALKDAIDSFRYARRDETASALATLQHDLFRYVRIANM